MASAERMWRRAVPVLWRTVPHGVVLLPLDAQEPFFLAGSGAALWDALDVPRTAAQVSLLLAEQHGVDAAQVTTDIEPVVQELIRRGAVVETW